jgi:CheY-like chemotaxis protein
MKMLEKILCVDDDQITLMLCKKVIEKVSFAKEIITAQNGEEALEYFKNMISEIKNDNTIDYPKLVLLDLNMPVMDGWEFLDAYVENNFQEVFTTKFIVLSSTIDPNDVNKSKTYSMVIDFLSKPITKEMLENLKIL